MTAALPDPGDPVWALRKSAPHEFFVELGRRFGDVVPYRAAPHPAVLVNHPDGVRHVLVSRARDYAKDTLAYHAGAAKLLFGRGLVMQEGEPWARQRRLVQPAFYRARIAGFTEVIVQSTQRAIARLASQPGAVDMDEEMMQLALTIIGRVLFDIDLGDRAEKMGRAFAAVLAFIPPNPPPSDPSVVEDAIAKLDAVAYEIIAERRRVAAPREDLLQLLLSARDPVTGEGMTDRELRDEIVTLLVGGHENSAHGLAWTFHLLATHPSWQEEVRREASAVFGASAPRFESVADLPVCRRVVDEAMRLYPPVWAFGRRALVNDEICGVAIEAGTSITISPYALHRNESVWPEPHRFDPDNFLSERSSRRPSTAYIPFGAGERVCVGTSLALVEAVLVTAMVVHRFELLPESASVKPAVSVTLRPAGGVPLRLIRRG